MAGFSQVTVTGNYGAGTTGTLTILLQQPMMNNAVTVPQQLLTVTLNTSGSFSQVLNANGDTGTTPQGVSYNVSESITGSPFADYSIFVPRIQNETDGTIKSSDLSVIYLSTATADPSMIGQSVSGPGITTGTVIASVVEPIPIQEVINYPFQPNSNSVTLSQPASGAGTGLAFTFGESIDISYLRPQQLGWA